MSSWTARVRFERALLAIEDPLGELGAVAPLSFAGAVAVIRSGSAQLRDHPTRPARAKRDDGLLMDALGLDRTKRGGLVRCPAHEDRSPSLSWKITFDKLLLHCMAGCSWDQILESVGMVTR